MATGHLGVFGLGYDDLSAGLNHELTWKIAGLLLATKLVATVACYGLGGCGGIFSPMLFLGGMCGICLAGLSSLIVRLSAPDQLALAVVGMSGCLGAVVRAPVTGILIVFEMTHEFSLVPALMIGALVSQTVSRWMNHHSFYDALIQQDGHQIEHVKPPRDLQGWQQLPVSAIANFRPVLVTDLNPVELKALLTVASVPALPRGPRRCARRHSHAKRSRERHHGNASAEIGNRRHLPSQSEHPRASIAADRIHGAHGGLAR